ncbi:hypothetical protein OUZ56_031011 [Daphnia magna]|uniref:Uncharacterized protein n=1 Tax=Daphnia magna TaxID=35525 RepID=A0ABQ9ZT05_9CRUS|nr:hypothetical protein OUZ56_031011 [Daphnia magna]
MDILRNIRTVYCGTALFLRHRNTWPRSSQTANAIGPPSYYVISMHLAAKRLKGRVRRRVCLSIMTRLPTLASVVHLFLHSFVLHGPGELSERPTNTNWLELSFSFRPIMLGFFPSVAT